MATILQKSAAVIRNMVSPSAVPPKHHRDVLKWSQEAIEESEQYLKSQPNYDKIADSIQAIMGD